MESRSSRDIAEVRAHIKNKNLTLKNHVLYGNDPIKLFHFLTRFVKEEDMLSMLKKHAIIVLQKLENMVDPTET